MANTGLAHRIFSSVTTAPPQADTGPESLADFCYCSVNECVYEEFAFFDATSNDTRTNDTSSFLFAKTLVADTVALELWKAGVKVADLDDNSLGTYYPTFESQPLYTGFVVNWKLVGQIHGAGRYQIKAQAVLTGIPSAFESRLFRVMPFDPTIAHGTWKLQTWQSGNILSLSVDYTGLVAGGWPSHYRLFGNFGRREPELTQDNYLTSGYKREQIQDSILWKYTAESKFLPERIAQIVSGDSILADRIVCTGYSLKDQDQYISVDVIPESIQTKRPEGGREPAYVILFAERNQNRVKRRF